MRVILLVLVLGAGCKPSKPTGMEAPPEFVAAPATGEVTALVASAVKEARKENKQLLVYVSAPWCEPCRRFQDAVFSHELDRELRGLRFLKFDRDRDEQRLRSAGYESQYIPLFVIPDQQGRASGRRMEGSVKGDKAVRENLLPRLLQLLATPD